MTDTTAMPCKKPESIDSGFCYFAVCGFAVYKGSDCGPCRHCSPSGVPFACSVYPPETHSHASTIRYKHTEPRFRCSDSRVVLPRRVVEVAQGWRAGVPHSVIFAEEASIATGRGQPGRGCPSRRPPWQDG